ncbi:hypothetical protein BHM03_00044558 [Ensete ventricosum]|nr:hypothetical protein BHM03_00044558 [Ensete ventricosum]
MERAPSAALPLSPKSKIGPSCHFWLPMLEAHDGSSDPMEHVAAFRAQMTLCDMSDAIMCRAFPMTLSGIARGWYNRLPPASIHSFGQLTREFQANFIASARPKPTTATHVVMRVIPDAHPSLVIQALMIGIRPSRFFWSLVERPPTTIREKGLLKAPNSIRTQSEEHDRGRYCHFHRDYGHDTDECYDLKNQIEDLICGHLDQFVRKPCKLSLCPKGPMVRQIDVIVGRPVAGGDSSSARKAYARAEVQKRPRARLDPEITFKSENEYPAHIVNAHVKPIMIDTGSSVDILYFDTF